jgi:adenosylhomocysteine nucleosidase
MSSTEPRVRFTVLISANTEWRVVENHFPSAVLNSSPYGSWFCVESHTESVPEPYILLHGGWGKVSAAASTQYVIDRWTPEIIINLGTCGGFKGEVEAGEIILAERTLIYDIYEQMHDPELTRQKYAAELDLSWLPDNLPLRVRRSILVSADRDLVPAEIGELHRKYGAIAGDWESGAIAYVAARNQVRCLILRGVSDLVSEHGGEAYIDENLFPARAAQIMEILLDSLPGLITALI